MPAATEYLDETHAPTREEIDRSTGRVLLEFGTSWCGICRALASRVAALLERRPAGAAHQGRGRARPAARPLLRRAPLAEPRVSARREGRPAARTATYDQLDEAFLALLSDQAEDPADRPR